MKIFWAATFDYLETEFSHKILICIVLFTLSYYRKGISENYKRMKVRFRMPLQKHIYSIVLYLAKKYTREI